MCVRALEAGWAGICFKTISFYPSHEVSPRFDQMEVDGVPFIGFKNMEQLSEALSKRISILSIASSNAILTN